MIAPLSLLLGRGGIGDVTFVMSEFCSNFVLKTLILYFRIRLVFLNHRLNRFIVFGVAGDIPPIIIIAMIL